MEDPITVRAPRRRPLSRRPRRRTLIGVLTAVAGLGVATAVAGTGLAEASTDLNANFLNVEAKFALENGTLIGSRRYCTVAGKDRVDLNEGALGGTTGQCEDTFGRSGIFVDGFGTGACDKPEQAHGLSVTFTALAISGDEVLPNPLDPITMDYDVAETRCVVPGEILEFTLRVDGTSAAATVSLRTWLSWE